MLLDLYPLEFPGSTSPSAQAQRMLDLIPDDWVNVGGAKQPGGWLYLLASAVGAVLSDCYTALAYVGLQTRIATATDTNLDAISSDFFGGALPRNQGETDAAFRTRLRTAIFANKATRGGIGSALAALGVTFVITEDGNLGDCMSLGVAGGWGAYLALGADNGAQGACFVTVSLPLPLTVTQAQVISTINTVKAEGTTVWLAFH